MAINIQQLAQKAGVSIATVSRALNGKPHVKKEALAKVLAAAKEMNYIPKQGAGSVKIPLIVETFDQRDMGIYECLVIARLTRLLAERRCHLELVQAEEIDSLQTQFTKVAIALTYSAEATRLLSRSKTPLISVNNPVKGALNICSEHYEESHMATARLIKDGHRRIGLCLSYIDGWGKNERLRGYKGALKDAGVEFDPLLTGDDSEDPGFLLPTTKALRYGATAIVAIGHDVGFHVAHALYLLNKRIPEDVSIVCTENQMLSQYSVPPHTACSQPLYEMAELAANEAMAIANGAPLKARDVFFKNELIERGSTCKLKPK